MREIFSFDNFIQDNSNRFAFAVSKIIVSQSDEINPVIFYGPSGCGKTHLACAIGSDFLMSNRKVIYTNANSIVENVIKNKCNIEAVYAYNANTDLLIVEDYDYILSRPLTEECIVRLLLKFLSDKKNMILICNSVLSRDTATFKYLFSNGKKNGMIVSISNPTNELKEKYLKKLIGDFKISIPNNLIQRVIIECETLPQIYGRLLKFKFASKDW